MSVATRSAIHRNNQPPVLLNILQDLTCEPELPGFKCPVKELFS
jgi:Uma2 family endonuclease